MIKKLLILLLCLTLIQCHTNSALNKKDYILVDTLHVARNGFNVIIDYDVILKIDTSYWSASMRPNGTIRSLDRKLNIKVCGKH